MKGPAIPQKPSRPVINAIRNQEMAEFNMVRFSNENEVLSFAHYDQGLPFGLSFDAAFFGAALGSTFGSVFGAAFSLEGTGLVPTEEFPRRRGVGTRLEST